MNRTHVHRAIADVCLLEETIKQNVRNNPSLLDSINVVVCSRGFSPLLQRFEALSLSLAFLLNLLHHFITTTGGLGSGKAVVGRRVNRQSSS